MQRWLRASAAVAALACACGKDAGAPCTIACTDPETFVNVAVMDASHQPVAGVTFTKDGSPTPLPATAGNACPLADGGACTSYRVDLGTRVASANLTAKAPNGATASALLQGGFSKTACCGDYSSLDEATLELVLK